MSLLPILNSFYPILHRQRHMPSLLAFFQPATDQLAVLAVITHRTNHGRGPGADDFE